MANEDTSRFDWDRHNLGHVARHKVKPQEVEQVLRNGPILIETEIDETAAKRESLKLATRIRVAFCSSCGLPAGRVAVR